MAAERDFIDALMGAMTLQEKVGQLNYPPSEGFDTTGVAGTVDLPERIRRGEIGGTAGANLEDRRTLQRLAVSEGPSKIPLLFGVDVIHGHKTVVPVPLGLACSWDLDLIERTGRMAATEARAEGINVTWSPMVDIGYDARWGRVAEGSGELVHLGAEIARTMVQAYQGTDNDLARPDRVMATLKHFAGYGLSMAGRDYNSVEASPATLHRIMAPFKAGIEAGAGALMVAFNTVNDIPATAHKELLQDLLREDWGFDGLVVTDFTAVMELINHGIASDLEEATYLAFAAGITTDLVSEGFVRHLPDLVTQGRVSMEEVDTACRRVLSAKWALGLFEDPFLGMDEGRYERVALSAQNRALAREAAASSCVLLKNEGQALPLQRDGGAIALIGPLAENRVDMQGTWAVAADPMLNVTLLEGFRESAGAQLDIHFAKGCNIVDDPNLAARLNVHNRDNPSVVIDPRGKEAMIEEALQVARSASVVVVCLGEAKEHAGESSTREDITIPMAQRPLFDALADYTLSAGKKLILVVIAGRPLALAHEAERADAILFSFHPGIEGGHAIADVLFGDVDPSGRLAMAFPRHGGQLPLQSEHLPTGRPIGGAGITVEGDDERIDGEPVFRKFTTATILEGSSEPLFPVGFGLGYTIFDYGDPMAEKNELFGEKDVLEVMVIITNTGTRAGVTTAQLYVRDPVATVSRPVLELKGFVRLAIEPGGSASAVFSLRSEDLTFIKARTISQYEEDWEEGAFEIMTGPHVGTLKSLSVQWHKGSQPDHPGPGDLVANR